jgi:hypothetical protein
MKTGTISEYGSKKRQSSRFFSEMSPSASTSKGFLIVGTRVTSSSTVQKHDFEDAALRGAIGGRPLIPKGLRKFKNFRRQLGRFVVAETWWTTR